MRVLIVWGGWVGHQPERTAARLARLLEERGHTVTMTPDLAIVLNDDLSAYDTLVPVWSCGIQSTVYLKALASSVKTGLGLACFHGGIDWFDQKGYYEIVGGLFVDDAIHTRYRVHIEDAEPSFAGHLSDFSGTGEVSHCLCDRENLVLAVVEADGTNYPYAWARRYGRGKVFYSMGAHEHDALFAPGCIDLIVAGIEWSAREREGPR